MSNSAWAYGMLSDTIGQLLHVKHKSLIADGNVIKALDNVSFDVKKARLWGLLAQMVLGKKYYPKAYFQSHSSRLRENYSLW